MPVPDLLEQRRFQIVGGVVVVALLVVALLVAQRSDDDQRVSLEGPNTTSSELTTTTSTTTKATTTTEATTTSTTVATTTSMTAPPVVTTAPPATAPPPTAPASSGSLDLPAVVAFAKGHRPDTPAPYMYSGSSCEVAGERIYDAGDDINGDLGTVDLTRDCDATFRLFSGANDGSFGAYWVEVDGGPGGCGGVDVVAVIWPGGSSTLGAVVTTPGCDEGSWTAIDTARNPGFPGKLLDFRGSSFGDPGAFRWRAGMLADGADTMIDRAPNAGFASFER